MNTAHQQLKEPSASEHGAGTPTASSRPTGRRRVDRSAALIAQCDIEALYYGPQLAVRETRLPLIAQQVTALIGPSGCGKSTVLRCFNRMNDFIPGFRLEGSVQYEGIDIYARGIDPVAVRRASGMVFQEPNPFAMSIYENVAFGLEINGYRRNHCAERIERALRNAALWDEVKDKLHTSALTLSGGQQQRLCIARAIAVEPALLLMDEPCSGLDPIASARIEELITQLKSKYTIAIVTHNLEQARRVSDYTAFFCVDSEHAGRTGYLVEYGPTHDLFGAPREKRTRAYLCGEFG